MKAVVVSRQGGTETLQQVDVPEPTPAAGELLVDVAAVGVNFRDLYERSGAYPHEVPFVPGRELAGTVVKVGPGVEGCVPGDVIVCVDVPQPGAYAQRAVVAAERAVRVWPGLSAEVAAALMLQGLTADYLCRIVHPVEPGDVAVIHAAAGGTGLLLTQMVTARGGRVIATVSSPAKVEAVLSAGADEVICRSDADVVAEVRRLTSGRGATVVFDSIGKATFDQSLDCLGPRGHLVLFGRSSGPVPPVDVHTLGPRGSITVHVPMLPDYVATRAELVGAAERLFRQVRDGTLRVHIGDHFPLHEARAAHEALQSGTTVGKILLIPPHRRETRHP